MLRSYKLWGSSPRDRSRGNPSPTGTADSSPSNPSSGPVSSLLEMWSPSSADKCAASDVSSRTNDGVASDDRAASSDGEASDGVASSGRGGCNLLPLPWAILQQFNNANLNFTIRSQQKQFNNSTTTTIQSTHQLNYLIHAIRNSSIQQ